MRVLSLIIISIIFCSSAFSQPLSAGKTTSTDTAGWTQSWNFAPTFSELSGEILSLEYPGGGWLYGNNADGHNECAQGFMNINQTTFVVEEVLLLFTGKTVTSFDPSAKCVVKLYSMAANKAHNTDGAGGEALNSPGPNQLLASVDYYIDDIDTNFGYWNIIELPVPVFINGTDFAVAVDFSHMNAKGDTAGLLSDSYADADGLDYAFHKIQNEWYVTDYFFSQSGTDDFDNNIAIFAVIDDHFEPPPPGMPEQKFFNGMKLGQNEPNPMNGKTVIQYELEKYSTNVELELFDIHGRKIIVVNEGQQTEGLHTIIIEETLPAGTYYYSLKANGNRLTKKMVVVQ